MPHDLLLKAALTAASVWLLLMATRRAGARVAGLAAGLPLTTAPALVLLGLQRGDAFVAAAAFGGLGAVAVGAVFAASYAACARRADAGLCLLASSCSAGVAALALLPLLVLSPPTAALCLLAAAAAAAVCVLARMSIARGLPRSASARSDPCTRCGSGSLLLVPLLVALTSTLTCWLSADWSPVACGLFAGLPVVAAATLALRRHHGADAGDAVRTLHGYVAGLLVRVVFTLVLAVLAGPLGWVAAMLLACAALVPAGLAPGLLRQLPRRRSAAGDAACPARAG